MRPEPLPMQDAHAGRSRPNLPLMERIRALEQAVARIQADAGPQDAPTVNPVPDDEAHRGRVCPTCGQALPI